MKKFILILLICAGQALSAINGVRINGQTGSLAGDSLFDETDQIQLRVSSADKLQLPAYTGNRTLLYIRDGGVRDDSYTTDDISAVISSDARKQKTLFDYFADANNGTTVETDLTTSTTAAGQLATNGDKLIFDISGIYTGAATSTQELKVKFAGTTIFDSGTLAIGAVTSSWTVTGTVIRESSTVVRCIVRYESDNVALNIKPTYTRITGLTLSGTNILKTTGQAAGVAAASNQITSKMGYIAYMAH